MRKKLLLNDMFDDISLIPKASVPRSGTSDRYWLSLESVCGRITKDDAIFLDNMIHETSKNVGTEISEVHPFTKKWACENLQAERFLSCALDHSEQPTGDLYIDNIAMSIESAPSLLTQRLHDAFNKELAQKVPSHSSQRKVISKRVMLFHKKLQQQFVKCVFKKKAKANYSEDNLVLEIRKSVTTLQLVNKHNLSNLNHLSALAAKDLRKQELTESLNKIDEELVAAYKQIVALKKEHGGQADPNDQQNFKISAEDEAKANKILGQQAKLQQEFDYIQKSSTED